MVRYNYRYDNQYDNQLKDDDESGGHKDPQRLEHLSIEICLQKKRELSRSFDDVATTDVDVQLRDGRWLA